MSAAEKLKALGEAIEQARRGIYVDVLTSDPEVTAVTYVSTEKIERERHRAGDALIAALPQIVAVVKAAEEVTVRMPTMSRPIPAALTALDDALSPPTGGSP